MNQKLKCRPLGNPTCSLHKLSPPPTSGRPLSLPIKHLCIVWPVQSHFLSISTSLSWTETNGSVVMGGGKASLFYALRTGISSDHPWFGDKNGYKPKCTSSQASQWTPVTQSLKRPQWTTHREYLLCPHYPRVTISNSTPLPSLFKS